MQACEPSRTTSSARLQDFKEELRILMSESLLHLWPSSNGLEKPRELGEAKDVTSWEVRHVRRAPERQQMKLTERMEGHVPHAHDISGTVHFEDARTNDFQRVPREASCIELPPSLRRSRGRLHELGPARLIPLAPDTATKHGTQPLRLLSLPSQLTSVRNRVTPGMASAGFVLSRVPSAHSKYSGGNMPAGLASPRLQPGATPPLLVDASPHRSLANISRSTKRSPAPQPSCAQEARGHSRQREIRTSSRPHRKPPGAEVRCPTSSRATHRSSRVSTFAG